MTRDQEHGTTFLAASGLGLFGDLAAGLPGG